MNAPTGTPALGAAACSAGRHRWIGDTCCECGVAWGSWAPRRIADLERKLASSESLLRGALAMLHEAGIPVGSGDLISAANAAELPPNAPAQPRREEGKQ